MCTQGFSGSVYCAVDSKGGWMVCSLEQGEVTPSEIELRLANIQYVLKNNGDENMC